MRLAVISFTRAGARICGKLAEQFREQGISCEGYIHKNFTDGFQGIPDIFALEEPVGQWTGRMFDRVDGLFYIGAAGIAVRAIAPYLKDKMTDPAVVVVDEQGSYAVSLLSGHVGGANRLARMAADILGAVPIITTASDVQGRTAVDVWAAERRLKLSDRELAKQTASALVNGEPVGFYSDYHLAEPEPEDYARGKQCRMNVWVTCRRFPEPDSAIARFLPEDAGILRLIPEALTVGIGCRRNTDADQVFDAVKETFIKHGLDLRAVARLASITIKKNEGGLLQTAASMQVPFVTYTAEELEQVQGEIAESAFVRKVTGTGNVCERAALLGAGPGSRLLVHKEICGSVTIAVAEARMEIERTEL
ncbi:cobalt-precorrin 5A hydrolase [Clostridium sp. AN503]|uniref:cobalt-precorrin 5A hydrolase n=1 Tax=Clostridium sp. AN503 TaxID=3160598 RepID=UPI00345953C6